MFKDAPDLLAEFKDFLPEITGQAPPSGLVGIQPHPSGSGGQSWGPSDTAAEKAGKKPIPPLKRRKKVVEKDTTPVPPAKSSANRVRSDIYSLLILCYL